MLFLFLWFSGDKGKIPDFPSVCKIILLTYTQNVDWQRVMCDDAIVKNCMSKRGKEMTNKGKGPARGRVNPLGWGGNRAGESSRMP